MKQVELKTIILTEEDFLLDEYKKADYQVSIDFGFDLLKHFGLDKEKIDSNINLILYTDHNLVLLPFKDDENIFKLPDDCSHIWTMNIMKANNGITRAVKILEEVHDHYNDMAEKKYFIVNTKPIYENKDSSIIAEVYNLKELLEKIGELYDSSKKYIWSCTLFHAEYSLPISNMEDKFAVCPGMIFEIKLVSDS